MKNYKLYTMVVLTLVFTACSPTTKEYQSTISSQTSNSSTIRPCTKEYLPVCGEVAIECITTPCEPIQQTFPNACVLGNNKKAKFLYKGRCEKVIKE